MSVFSHPERYYDDPEGFVAWDGSHVVRTDDIMASSPTWEEITGSVTGTIYDGQCVIETDGKVVLWLLTSTAVWVCRDIEAVTPVWEEALAIATVQASDADPTPEVPRFMCFATYPQEAGFVCVATGPTGGNTDNWSYAHAYFWHTHDYGDTWTSVDVGGVTGTSRGFSFVYAPMFGMEIFPDEVSGNPGTIYCIRFTPQDILNTDGRVFSSTNGGHTWSINAIDLGQGFNERTNAALSAPGPTTSDYAYLVKGDLGVSDRPELYRSNNGWTTQTQLITNDTPTGYGGVDAGGWRRRVGKRHDSDDYLLIWLRHTASAYAHLMESSDAGSTFTLLYNPGTGTYVYASPLAWPGDPDIWALVQRRVGGGLNTIVNAVKLTVDGFGSVDDKTGNLDSLIASWSEGECGGCFLPKEPIGECPPTATYTYNGTDITTYISELELNLLVEDLDKPSLGNTARAAIPGRHDGTLSLAGDWSPEIDAVFGPEANRNLKRTAVLTFDNCLQTVTYTWTSGVSITGWTVRTAASGKIVWGATLRHHVVPVRTVN